MKTYVFLAHTIGGLTGSATYVRNKTRWLEERGWNVIAFDGTGDNNSPIVIEVFKRFKSNRLQELYFVPSMYFSIYRNFVLRRIIKKIPPSDKIVIESNNSTLALWGEQLSKKLHSKHIVYLLGEHESAESKELFDFFSYKSKYHELFCISSRVAGQLFSKYTNEYDAERMFWKACNDTEVEDLPCQELDNITKADVNIGYFGRLKPYTKSVLESVRGFADNNPGMNINFVMLGVEVMSQELLEIISVAQIKCYFISSKPVIPKKFFELTDVIIGNAACAKIAFNQGAKVISINVETNKPLGVVGYTTDEISFQSEYYNDTRSLNEILDDVLVKKSLVGKEPNIQLLLSKYGYEYQEKCIDEPKSEPYSVFRIKQSMSLSIILKKIMLNLGLVKMLSEQRYNRKQK